MPAPDRVLRAAEALDDDGLIALVSGLSDESRRAVAGALRVTANAFFKASSPTALLIRSLRRLPPAARADVAHLLTESCLDDVVEALGDDADDPTRDQLLAVLDPIIDKHGSVVTALMLAATAGGDAPARAACAEILDSDERFRSLSEPSAPPPDAAPKRKAKLSAQDREAREAEKAARRKAKQERKAERRAEQERREAAARAIKERQREARRSEAESPSEAPEHAEEIPLPVLRPIPEGADLASGTKSTAAASATSEPEVKAQEPEAKPVPISSDGLVTVSTRAAPEVHKDVRLIGHYDGLIEDDPLITAIVLANVPFDDGTGSKVRPAVVVGATKRELVVRACFSEGGARADDWRFAPVGDWREAGLDGPSLISDEEILISRSAVRGELGRLTAADWNQL